MNFHIPINRINSASLKWDRTDVVYGSSDILPLWVADMDFAAPPAVIRALQERAEHGVLGYSYITDSYLEAIAGWMKSRHNWDIRHDWIQFCPGVVPALSLMVECYTKPGEAVMIQTPVYPPFYQVVKNHGRQLVLNPLHLSAEGDYTMDFDRLEQDLDAHPVKMLILCSPHNPVGRVWTRSELERLAEICTSRGVIVVSDEIHADLVFEAGAHTPFAAVSTEAEQCSVICTAPSKTFNMAGLNTANMIIPNPKLRSAFRKALQRYSLSSITPTGLAATEAAYREGGEWLDALLEYIQGNMTYVREYIQQNIPELKVNQPEATYLLWIDFRELGLSGEELARFLLDEAKLALNAGNSFGQDGEGFMRMNVGCTRQTLEEAMQRLDRAVAQRRV
ncbi:MalY/PatB family protein [Paenibacillus sp. FJAT-26967]|uniref:MalY/PatB family protein n=1 Tax=Paenibacillus sp. FJAT-26967 TaxID=1729690 RepID=UPI0008386531|nr:MalY/PatB family protein [Paenibacillus sp. FJAT-26967]